MIAYYAHKHGFGHSNSAQQFCKLFRKKALVITSSKFDFDEAIDVIKICNEDTLYPEYLRTSYNLPRYAHYLPKSVDKILHRNFQILETCISDNIRFALVDVSVETAIQFRISGIPYAYHKMLGNRKDLAHQLAYESSEFLFAYYPKVLEYSIDNHYAHKTYYLGFISRFKFRNVIEKKFKNKSDNLKVLLLTGHGGTKLTSERLKIIYQQNYKHKFTVIGKRQPIAFFNVNQIDFTNNLERLFEDHDIIISSCGLNLTAEILSVKNKFIAFPEDRPYKEQKAILDGLVKNSLAVELNMNDIELSIEALIKLPINKNLESYFGSMNHFKKIKELKKYL